MAEIWQNETHIYSIFLPVFAVLISKWLAFGWSNSIGDCRIDQSHS